VFHRLCIGRPCGQWDQHHHREPTHAKQFIRRTGKFDPVSSRAVTQETCVHLPMLSRSEQGLGGNGRRKPCGSRVCSRGCSG
jgi:hypothetical protein